MKALIVEDDFISRKILLKFMLPLGECDIATNGSEAVEAFLLAHSEGKPYDLITLDIMMPEMNGQEALKRIRQTEEDRELPAAKIIMTTSLSDAQNVMTAFKSQSDGYLLKRIDRADLHNKLRELGLID